ncbi:hypothetical protein IUY40_06490 [Flavobacterium sp. ALJ2]|uniref:hypothetical protein n=1 Tax=Flavobacterium sp. ALJ2 TaxID=2786960 RepID=UPI00189E7C44|nr:hypothetical protein [Flavobacterium sp. ALJ2]MBF7091183.1 hypothetical protein [Flavobacterium sp. ALJ2]
MQEELRGRIYQDDHFVVSDFSDVILEGLVGMEDEEDGRPVIVFIKIKGKNWHRFFLDAGYGFWENWEEEELDKEEWAEDEVVYVDYIEKYNIKNKSIDSVFCKEDKITIQFKNKDQFVLQTITLSDMDSSSEINFIKNDLQEDR